MSGYSNPKYAALLNEMNRLTFEGNLKWHIDDDLRASRRDVVVGHVYVTTFRGKSFAIHEAKSKYYYDEDAWAWQYSVQFEIVDNVGRMGWELPSDTNQQEASSLLAIVREKTSGIDAVIDAVMRGD